MASTDKQSTIVTLTIVAGMFMALGGNSLHGFVGGALQGAGLALMLLGVYSLGALWRVKKKGAAGSDSEKWWLPSEDEQG